MSLLTLSCGRLGFDAFDAGENDTPVDLLSLLDDDFGDDVLDLDWIVINAEQVVVAEGGGVLTLEALDGIGFWTSNRAGPLFYRNVTGDFIITATLKATSATDITQSPSQEFSLGGLLARDSGI